MIAAIVQARMTSSRFPGKVLADIAGKPTLLRVIERLRQSTRLQKIIVATSNDQSDEPIEHLCQRMGIDFFRGDLEDVLNRFYRAAVAFDAQVIVRITADCPLIDSSLLDQVVMYHNEQNADYTSNINPPTFPDGLDIEVFNRSALEKAHLRATNAIDREHVTHYIYSHPQEFKVSNYLGSRDLSNIRLTLDYPADQQVISRVYQHFAPSEDFSLEDLLSFVETNGECVDGSAKYERNASLKKQKEVQG